MRPTDAELQRVADELKTIAYDSQWERVLAIGRLVFGRFFRNDEGMWRERRRNKDHSIRRLADRPGCPFGKSALTEAVGIYVFCNKHPQVRTFVRITPTHVAKALGLEPAQTLKLLQAGQAEGWSVKDVAAAATRLRKEMGDRRGRPVSGFDRRAGVWGRRAIEALEHMHAELAAAPFGLHEARKDLGPICARLAQKVAAIEAVLQLDMPERRGPMGRFVEPAFRRVDIDRALGPLEATTAK